MKNAITIFVVFAPYISYLIHKLPQNTIITEIIYLRVTGDGNNKINHMINAGF